MKEQAIAEMRNDTVAQVQVQADQHPVQVTETGRQKRKMIHEEVVRNPVMTAIIRHFPVEIVHHREIGEIATEEADPTRGQKDAQLQIETGHHGAIIAEVKAAIITDLQ